MPVPVNLMDLVQLRGAQAMWPAEFAKLAGACEAATIPATPDGAEVAQDRSAFGAIADWIDEHAGEPEYAAAWRWLARRPKVALRRTSLSNGIVIWSLPDPPHSLGYGGMWGDSEAGLPQLVAVLAGYLKKARSELE